MRPETTLFALMSVDGKISTGASNEWDFDKDLPKIPETASGLQQYYEAEIANTTNAVSFGTGLTQEKVLGPYEGPIEKLPVDFVIVDSCHLSASTITKLAQKANRLIIATTNPDHIAYSVIEPNLSVISICSLPCLMDQLGDSFGYKKVILQCGGTMNSSLFKHHLIDHLDLFVAPIVIGGANTPSLVDGCCTAMEGLVNLSTLKLRKATVLESNYLRLQYDVESCAVQEMHLG